MQIDHQKAPIGLRAGGGGGWCARAPTSAGCRCLASHGTVQPLVMVWREPAYNGRRAGSRAGRKVMSVISQLNIKDAVPIASRAERPRPLKVGVLVDLALTPEAGGHVKCWQRLAGAATGYTDRLDLTVHFNGPEPRRIELSRSVRYVLLPPVFSTARLIRQVPDHTDLAPWHPRLAQLLAGYDVIHTTDAFFCYARTAARFSRRHGVPMVSSIHTNTPEYARITTARLLERALGRGKAYRVANGGLALPDMVSSLLDRRLIRHLESVTFAMGSYG